MASYRKRGKSYEIHFTYKNKSGEKEQGTQTVKTKAEAERLCREYNDGKDQNDYIAPSNDTISSLLDDFVDSYGKKKWGHSQYEGKTGLMRNYIKPLIGKKRVQTFTTRDADIFLDELSSFPAARQKFPDDPQPVTPATVREIGSFMRTVFKQAKKWNLVKANPFEDATLPEYDAEERDMWDADTIAKALSLCRRTNLFIAMHIAFACNTREGEICGLQWSRVYISDKDIENDNARIIIDRTLSRVSKKSIEKLGKKDIILMFPTKMITEEDAKQRLVLKKPKTKSSERTVWIPATLARILRRYKEMQEDTKRMMGAEYKDYGLVLAQNDGTPYDGNLISRRFRELVHEHNLPKVVFHSLRVSATTYKLALSKGDIKSVQGDNGHATTDMTLRTYARVLDSGRKVNAQRFEEFFYPGGHVRGGGGDDGGSPAAVSPVELIEQIKKSPELLATLAVVLKDALHTQPQNMHNDCMVTTEIPCANRPQLRVVRASD